VKILDLSGGHRNIWFNRFQSSTIYIDNRPEVLPNVLCDSRQLPFPDASFDHIVFDPPHAVHGIGSKMARYYGAYSPLEIQSIIRKTSREAYRVLKDEGFMNLKWNDHDIRLDHILKFFECWEPLYGQKVAGRSKHRSGTYWVALIKRPLGYQSITMMQRLLDFDGELMYQHKTGVDDAERPIRVRRHRDGAGVLFESGRRGL
jgi:SAM-dependent methyltransferase